MEKRSNNYRAGIVGEEFEEEELDIEFTQVEPEPPAGVWLRSNYPGTIITMGAVSGKRYVFSGGGSTVQVDAEDAPSMLVKTFGGYSCCGSGAKPTPKFVVVEM